MFKYLNKLYSFCIRHLFITFFVIIVSSLALGFMRMYPSLYYVLLILILFLMLSQTTSISLAPFILIGVAAISLIMNTPPAIFSAWPRLGLFTLLICSVFPTFDSVKNSQFRNSVFQLTVVVVLFIGISSLPCYFAGINYMIKAFGKYGATHTSDTAGWFGGLTRQSMMLAPLCAFAATYYTAKLFSSERTRQQKWLYGAFIFSCMCGILLSASRIGLAAGLAGCLSVFILKYKGNTGKLISQLIGIGIILSALYPISNVFTTAMTQKSETNLEKGSFFASREDRWGHRLEEWSRSPVFGIGFATIDTQYSEEFSDTGIVETGSGWLAVLSMTGLAGAFCMGYIVLSTLKRLYRRCRYDNHAILLFSLIMVFVVHLCAEGYIFAGGSFLCYLFWLTLGVGYTYSRAPENERKNLKFEVI